jgi:OmpA-OmpF porin, OOP family
MRTTLTILAVMLATMCLAQSGAISNKIYDFVPRTDIIFEDDFTQHTSDMLPYKWHLSECDELYTILKKNKKYCKVEKEGNTFQFNHSCPDKEECSSLFEPNLSNLNYLTDSFTVECDVQLGYFGSVGVDMFTHPGRETCDGDIQIFLERSILDSTIRYENSGRNRREHSIDSTCYHDHIQFPRRSPASEWHHFALSYYKGRLSAYLDQYPLSTTPSCSYRPYKFVLELCGNVCISNFRLATGKKDDALNKLLTEKKFVTHAINFPVNSYIIDRQSMTFIYELAAFLQKNMAVKLEIDGHTDSDGITDANMALSQKRAEAIKGELMKLGIDKNRLTAKGWGDTKPLQPNTSAPNKAINRRVELLLQ